MCLIDKSEITRKLPLRHKNKCPLQKRSAIIFFQQPEKPPMKLRSRRTLKIFKVGIELFQRQREIDKAKFHFLNS